MSGRTTAGVAGDRSGAACAAGGARAAAGRGAGAEQELRLAALYARVSTDKQEKEATIESQLDALQRAAAERGYAVIPEYTFVDTRHSGARLDRPALDRLRDLATEGAFEVVLVSAPDRLARQYAYQVVSWRSSGGRAARSCSSTTPSARRRSSRCSCRSRASSPSTSAR